jgi:hypothetical protein
MHRRPTRDGRPLAQKWDEENCDPELLLRRIGKELRENNQNLSGASESVSFAAEKQSHRPIRDGLRIASGFESWRGESSLARTSALMGMGRRATAFTDSVPIALLLLQSADKSID